MKLCKDCAYYRPSQSNDWQLARCSHPKNMRELNLVTGEPKAVHIFCEEMRRFGPCGAEAAWFEPKLIQASA